MPGGSSPRLLLTALLVLAACAGSGPEGSGSKATEPGPFRDDDIAMVAVDSNVFAIAQSVRPRLDEGRFSVS